MDTMSRVVRHIRLYTTRAHLRGDLIYDTADPYAVTLIVRERTAVRWTFARDLLRDGRLLPTGMADVQVSPNGGLIRIRLESPDGRATIHLERADVNEFLVDTFALVPDGREAAFLDLDAKLAELLEGETA